MTKIDFVEESIVEENKIETVDHDHALFNRVEKQLIEYFDGKRKVFELPIFLNGTIFQQEVWQALQTIPYGQSCSYQDIAKRIDRDKAVRAVGQANRKNPLPIIIPCHRVNGKNGALTGYAGNQTNKKEYLLKLEQTFYVNM
ncbi:methylated-DNA--protein-cysteine methyltransferase [Jeotgalibacillus soli]|uniref:methylated-DNA--[protein]-cysteine S-methyltransferase n=1 Tax=Jeotgalibacillus soli TaxID=889306 RepID=A0A0C2VPC4_9BACL|nr:methylated-DNA--protein-cysteine methyltransferase [Jeotgalibacillus soli]